MKKIIATVLVLMLTACLAAPALAEVNLVTTTSQVVGGPTQLLQEQLTAVAAEMGSDFSFRHYDSSTLFKSAAEFQALVDHNVDVAFLSTSWFYDNGAPWCDMYASTYLFNSYEHVKETFDPTTEAGQKFQQAIYDEFHIWPVCCFNLSSRNLWINDDQLVVNTPEDLKGLLLRVPNGASWMKLGESIGASPTTLDTNEVYLALQTGTIKAQENNMISSFANSFYEVTNTLVMTQHQYTFNLVCVAGDVWDSLDDGKKEALSNLIVEAVDRNDKVVADKEIDIIKQCQENGMTIQTPDLDAFREYAHEYYLSSPEAAYWDMDAYNAIIEAGKKY